MDNINPPELLRHLDKESEVLTEAHQSILSELQRLHVEEEMLMRTFHNLLSSQGLIKKRETTEQGSEEQHTQATEGSLAFSEEEYFAAMRIEMDTQQRTESGQEFMVSKSEQFTFSGSSGSAGRLPFDLNCVSKNEEDGLAITQLGHCINYSESSVKAVSTVSCLVQIYVVIVQRRFMPFLVTVERTFLSKRMYHVKRISLLMFILSFFTLMLPTTFSLTTRRKILEVYTPIGIFYHQNKLRILMPKSQKTGKTKNTFLIQKTKSLRDMMTFQRKFQTQMPQSQRTGTMKRMVSGKLQTIPNPEYKGKWVAPMIDNPDFKDDQNSMFSPV